MEYLAAGLASDRHDVRVLDLRLHPDALSRTALEFRPDAVGVTAFSMHVRRALAVCAEVKELLPSCLTIIGGHHATLLPEDFFAPQVDHVVCGEGVAPLRALLGGAGPPEEMPGVWTNTATGFVSGGPAKDFTLDSLPPPNREVTQSDRHRYFIDWMKPVALLRTTVGCPFRCTFCSLWKIMDGRYHMRDDQGVVDELRSIREPWVFLVDDEAFIHGRRMTHLASAIHAAGIHKRFFAYTRMDSIVREVDALAAWRRVGLERLFVGIDAISDETLNDYNKRCKVAQIEAGLAIADRLGIEIFAQFVVSPLSTQRDFQRLVRFIEHHNIRYPSFTVLTPIPGTSLLGDFSGVVNKQPNGRPDWDLFDCQNAVTATKLPAEEFRKLYRGLYHTFKGAYTQYRDHPHVITDPSLRGNAAPPTIAKV